MNARKQLVAAAFQTGYEQKTAEAGAIKLAPGVSDRTIDDVTNEWGQASKALGTAAGAGAGYLASGLYGKVTGNKDRIRDILAAAIGGTAGFGAGTVGGTTLKNTVSNAYKDLSPEDQEVLRSR